MTRSQLVYRQIKYSQKIHAGIFEFFRDNKELHDKWFQFIQTPEFREAKIQEKPLLCLALIRREIGDSRELDELVDVALLMNSLVLNRLQLFMETDEALSWFKSPQVGLKGEIPWILMQSTKGTRKVRNLLKLKKQGESQVNNLEM